MPFTARTLNIAAYRFTAIDDIPRLIPLFQNAAQSHGLRGTILLAEEGINLFLAGPETGVTAFLTQHLASDPRFAGMTFKRSWSDSNPFRKMRVRHRPEIIRMNMPTIRPALGRAPVVAPRTLCRWLDQGHDDQGRKVVMLDTRNQFEVKAGRFQNAIDWQLERFSQFPQALADHLEQLRDVTVVSYCTGGIRCEKAAILMQDMGLGHSFQLDGGILQYFEQVGNHHYDGHCVVFDERQAVDAQLAPASQPSPS